MSGDVCGCRTQAEGNTGTYGTEAEEAAKHLINKFFPNTFEKCEIEHMDMKNIVNKNFKMDECPSVFYNTAD